MRHPKSWAAAVLVWAAALLLNGAARSSQTFAEWYASHVYPLWVNTLGRLCSLLPFSLVEWLLYGGLGLALFFLGRLIFRLIWENGRRWERLWDALRRCVWTAGILLLVFTLGGGINYQRKTFGELAGLTVEGATAAELAELYRELAEQVNGEAGLVAGMQRGFAAPGRISGRRR